MAQLLTVRINKPDHQPLGFRLQGGKDFGTPLVVQKVNGGSAAERAGLQAGDALIRVNNTDVYALRHQEAQDTIRATGPTLELTVQRGGGTWRPSVTPTGSLPRPGSRPLGATPTPVTSTSLKATPQPSQAFGSGHNSIAKPFGYMNGNDAVKSIVNKQYNTPVNMYSEQTIAETLSAQTEVLAGGVLGVNFKKNEKCYDAEKSAVFKALQEDTNDPEPELSTAGAAPAVAGLRHVQAPVTRPDAPINNTGGLPPGQNICEECERLITGVFVRIKDKNLHVECFKCSTCGTSLKNQGYYNISGKLYCDIHAKLVARQNPPAPHLEPVTVPPGGRIPTGTYSTPLPPLTTNYTNGSTSLFSPGSTLSGPKPFGSPLGSAYSPASMSPRSAPMSPPRSSHSAHAPPPFAPTNEMLNQSTPKPEFKSSAEERLIRKMAKMALNGYEIGIQRKIKPANHIQSMADKIQDTVVTKHPLNADAVSEDKNNESPSIRFINKPLNKNSKISDSTPNKNDKINGFTVSNMNLNGGAPIPPPMPSIPITNIKGLSSAVNNIPQKDSCMKNITNQYELNARNFIVNETLSTSGQTKADVAENKNKYDFTGNCYSEKNNFINDESHPRNLITNETLHTNGQTKVDPAENKYKYDVIGKIPSEKINFLNDSLKRDFPKNEEKEHGNLSRFNITSFEGLDNSNIPTSNLDKKNEIAANSNNDIKLEKNIHFEYEKNKKKDDDDVSRNKTGFNNLHDNTLYTFKSDNANIQNIKDESNDEAIQDTVIKRRIKNTEKNTEGKRDSHIIARPLSTMTSADVADGLYPVCHICDKAITRGPFITALGRIWCPDHFICVNATCRRPLQDIGFVEENGQLYCEYCFEQYIAPACDKCHAKIKGDCLNAIGKHYHPECFNCVYCGKLFGNNPFFLEDGLPYCESDWNELFTTKCFSCGFPVEAGDRWVEALNNNYHSQCFNCTVCKKNLEGQSFFAKGGRPFCKTHAR